MSSQESSTSTRREKFANLKSKTEEYKQIDCELLSESSSNSGSVSSANNGLDDLQLQPSFPNGFSVELKSLD